MNLCEMWRMSDVESSYGSQTISAETPEGAVTPFPPPVLDTLAAFFIFVQPPQCDNKSRGGTQSPSLIANRIKDSRQQMPGEPPVPTLARDRFSDSTGLSLASNPVQVFTAL